MLSNAVSASRARKPKMRQKNHCDCICVGLFKGEKHTIPRPKTLNPKPQTPQSLREMCEVVVDKIDAIIHAVDSGIVSVGISRIGLYAHLRFRLTLWGGFELRRSGLVLRLKDVSKRTSVPIW